MHRPLLLAALAALACSSPAFAADTVSRYAPTRAPNLTLAKPTHVVAPKGVPASYKGTVVYVAMTIDEHGVPHNVTAEQPMPRAVAKRLLPAVAKWRFSPVHENGRAVSARVVLPIALAEPA